MSDLKNLSKPELEQLYLLSEDLRSQVNELVNKYGYTANDLTTRRFAMDLESIYGKKILNEKWKLSQPVTHYCLSEQCLS